MLCKNIRAGIIQISHPVDVCARAAPYRSQTNMLQILQIMETRKTAAPTDLGRHDVCSL